MARIRTVKPEFFRHEGLFELERETGLPIRLAFAGLWTAADKEGRFKWAPRSLKLDCLPFDDCDFSRVLDALRTRGCVVKYVCDGREFGYIPSWADHQIINNRESASVLPEPTKDSIESMTSTREARVDHATGTRHGNFQGEGKGKEGKGKEGEREDAPRKRDATPSKPDGVTDRVWTDWLQLRKAKRAPVTETVITGAEREAVKARMSLDEFLSIWCRRGSQGLEADWIKPGERRAAEVRGVRDDAAMQLLGFGLDRDVIEG